MHANDQDTSIRAVRFREYGEPADVLRQEDAALPQPGPERIRVAVTACGLNPADWALCRGLFAGLLPRGIGLEVSGTVTAVGDGVDDVAVGDAVFGAPDYADCTSAGLADQAIMLHWTRIPDGLDRIAAASMPMVVETAFRSIESLGVGEGDTLFVNGGGTMVGFAAVQMALLRGARVVASAGETFAAKLRDLGATVVAYGSGMADRVREAVGGAPDLVLDTSPPGGGVLPTLIEIADGNPAKVLTITDFEAANALGVRNSVDDGSGLRYDVLGEFADLAVAGKFHLPIAGVYAFDDWREAMQASLGGHAHGKVMIAIGDDR